MSLSPPSNLTTSHLVIPCVSIVDRFNKDIVEIALSLEEEETVELHRVMTQQMPSRRVSDRYKHGNYSTNAEAIVLGSWSYRKPYIMCGMPGYGGAPSSCHQTFVCECCCRKAAARMYVRYEKTFHQAQHWYALTYSFTSNLFLDTTTQADFLERYATADRFLKSLRVSGLIQGAVAVKEVSVNSFQNKAVFPHTHAVMNSDRDDLVDAEGNMHESFLEESRKAGVSLRLVRITDPQVFLYELKYPLKPINIKALYQEEALNYSTDDINLGVDMILGRLTNYSKGKPRIIYYGNMDARRKEYIGTAMNEKRKATRKLQALTKELNSVPASPTMVNEHVSTKEAVDMPPIQQPVLPPQEPRKKRSLWGPLALGLGAGVAGLGAADFFLNKGRVTNSLVESFKRRFGGSSSPVTPPGSPTSPTPLPASKPVTLGLPRTQADVMADAAAGTIGSGANSGARDAWKKWLAIESGAAREQAFAGVHGQRTAVPPPTPSSQLTNPLAMNSEEGTLDHFLRNVGQETGTTENAIQGALDRASGKLQVGHTLGWSGLGLTGAALNRAKTLPLVGSSLAASPTYTKLLGGMDKINNLLAFNAPKVPGQRFYDRMNPAYKTVSRLGGLTEGYSIGGNPLVVESLNDLLPGLSSQQAGLLSRGLSTLGGGFVGARVPGGFGTMGLSGIDAIHNNSVETLRQMEGATAGRGNLGDLMARWYKGTRSGNPLHRNALERALKYIDESPELQQSISGEKAAPGWKFWNYFSPDTLGQDGWGGDTGSPALQSLINKSRQAIMQ